MDIFSKTKRSEIMRSIKGKDTKPEKIVRSLLHSMGYRFRIHVKDLPGSPDIVLPKHKSVIFVHGCFWHGHNCKIAKIPKTETPFWMNKFEKNKLRDEKNQSELRQRGWKVFVIWECETGDREALQEKISELIRS